MNLVKCTIAAMMVVGVSGGAVLYNNGTNALDSKESFELNSQVKSYILQGTTPDKLQAIVETIGGNVSREFPIINAVSAMLTEQQARQIREKTDVRIQDDRTVTTSNGRWGKTLLDTSISVVDDSISILQNNFGSMNNFIAEQTGADRLHDMGIRGKGVTVAVLDSGANTGGGMGFYLNHGADGAERATVRFDAANNSKLDALMNDANGHGTHVSNIIASSQKGINGKYNGIAPDVDLVTIKAFDENGNSSYSKVLTGLDWIYKFGKNHNIRVVNMSLGAKVQSYYWDDPINQAVMKLWEAGIVVVSSAGNNGQDMGITVPGNNPYVITVGAATDSGTAYDVSDDRLTSFSAKGPTYEGFVKPEVIAYGANISTQFDSNYVIGNWSLSLLDPTYVSISGTSQAAALVSGIAALIISNDPGANPNDVKCKIMEAAMPASDGDRATYSPFQQGTGLVNAYGAVMSNASGCANLKLDITADLAGTKHFVGPTKVDDNGKYYIELSDGSIFTEGMHWGSDDMNLNGMHWSSEDMRLDGVYWSQSSMELNGTHWGSSEMAIQGMYWGSNEMNIEGLHWGDESMNVNGVDFTKLPKI